MITKLTSNKKELQPVVINASSLATAELTVLLLLRQQSGHDKAFEVKVICYKRSDTSSI